MIIYYNAELDMLGYRDELLANRGLVRIDETNVYMPLTDRWVIVGEL